MNNLKKRKKKTRRKRNIYKNNIKKKNKMKVFGEMFGSYNVPKKELSWWGRFQKRMLYRARKFGERRKKR